MFRGMLVTAYVDPAPGVGAAEVLDALRAAYDAEPFVHVTADQPRTQDVMGTNHCHVTAADAFGQVVVTSAIDNLVKGAAGQAVNMNVASGSTRRGLREPQIVKVGGAILDDAGRARASRRPWRRPAGRARRWSSSTAAAAVSRLMGSLGLEARRIRGLRVIDAATARAVVQGLRAR